MNNRLSLLACGLLLFAVVGTPCNSQAGYNTACYFTTSSFTGTEGATLTGTVYRHSVVTGGTGDWNISAPYTVTLWLDPTGQTYPIPCADISSPWGSCQVNVTIPAWAYSANFSVPFVNDGTSEYDQTSALKVTGYVDNTVIQSASLTELDNDNTNGLAVYSGGQSYIGSSPWTILQGGTGGANSLTLRFFRSYAIPQPRTVNYTTSGDAVAGTDYTPALGTVTIPASAGSTDITISANNSSQTTTKTLTVAMDAGAYQMYPGATTINVTIIPNYPGVGVIPNSDMLEGGAPGSFTVYRTPAYQASPAKTIYYTVSGSASSGSDFTALSGSVVIPAGSASAAVQVTSLRDLIAEGIENVVVSISPNAGYSVISTNAAASIDLYDDTPAIGVYATNYSLVEGQQTSLVFYNTNAHGGTPQITINYGLGGTAGNGSDYSSLSGSVTLPAGTYSVAVPISSFTDSLVEGAETLNLWVQSNSQYLIDSAGSNLVISIADDYPVVQVQAADAYAAEAGLDPGMFTITRTGNTNRSITVQLNVTGTATPGADYTALPATVVLGAGVLSANLAVTPLANAGIESAETVVLSLKPDASYVLGLHTNEVVTITGEGANPRDGNPKGLRYVRGAGTNLQASSIVVPLDGLKGTRRTDLETNGWFSTYGTCYHYNATNAGSQAYITNRIAFNTPIASFGGSWGQSLFIGQSYALGIAQGSFTADPLMIIAFWRTNLAQAGVVTLSLPQIGNSNDWTSFATNGFARSTNGFGLTTVLRNASDMDWGTGLTGWAFTHTATDAATNYFYLVCAVGTCSGQYMVLDGSSSPNYGYFYELSFEQHPAWRSLFVDQPHFQGEPLPPDLWNKSPDELLHYGALVTNAVSLAPAACQAIDQSPELRRHPLLDQFVADMNNDPLALANYVQNEIDLTDPIAYRDDGSVSTVSVNEGGVNRGALGVYLEGQGSPVEQCALLVYLLRQAGYPACYVFPPEGGLKMLDKRLSALLRTRLNGAQDDQGRLYTTNQLITVNYPWVAAYVNNQWVHLFPWAKDTAVEEGLNISDYLPSAYKETQLWVRDYLLGKSNIMAFATLDDDTPGTVFPRFLNSVLQTNAPGISLDDLGMRYINRRHAYAQWTDFPRPTWVTNVNAAVESLASTDITNVSPALTNLFDTVQVELYSVSNPQKKMQTPAMRMADLHNRKFYLTHTNLGGGQIQAVLTLGPFRPDATGAGTFSSGDATLTNRQVLAMALDGTDDHLKIRFRHRRQRALTWETALDPDRGFLDLTASREVLAERPLRVGDVGAICFNAGRVTPAMLRIHAQELWNMEQMLSTNSVATNQVSIDVYQGSLVYLMGMSYYERASRFDQENRRLFKVQNLSSFAMGLAKISPRRNPDGTLYNGTVDPVWPNVDMFFQEVVTVGNGTVRLDSGWDNKAATRNYYNLSIADLSAQEHAAINVFFGQSNAVSTVKLLQLAQSKVASGGSNVVELTHYNYQSAGTNKYNGKALKDYDPATWAQVVEMFQRPGSAGYVVGWMPPGPQTNASGSFAGMGAFVLGVDRYAALIGNNQYGAYGDRFNFGSVGSWNTPNFLLQQAADGDYTMDFSRTANLLAESWTTPSALQTASLFANGSLAPTPFQSLQGTAFGLAYNGLPGTYSSILPGTFDLGLQSTRTDYRDGNSWWQNVADPVNALTGEFYIDDVDLSLPGPMPLQVRRNYGSQNLANNQLGYGWKLNYMPYLTVASASNIVYEAEADGSVLAFGPVGTDLWAPTLALNPTLNNNSASGIGSVANRLNARLARLLVSGTNTWYLTNSDGSLRTFQEISFPLTNSASYDRLRPYLTKWQDNRGNFYRFEYGLDPAQGDYGQVRRIVSSSGNIVRLLYDQYSRVVEAYSADGRRVRYDFDIHGDLRTVTLPDASEINYEYQVLNWTTNGATSPYSTHLLTREEKPDGRVLQNEFDSQRRVTNQWATVGPDLRLVRNATFRYTNDFNLTNLTGTISGTTTILDYTNNPTTYFYTNGLIRRILDPLGAEIVQQWYEASETNAPAYPRSLKTVTDKRNLVTSYFYDSKGNATNVTLKGDLKGDGDVNAVAATITIFNGTNNLPEMTISPTGATNLFFYTNTWLLARLESWPSNATPAQVVTNLYSYVNVTNADGTAAYGLRAIEVRAAYSTDAATSETTFSSRGFPIRLVRYTGTADPAMVVTNLYNSRGELVQTINPQRSTINYTYTPRGNPESKEVFDAGQSIPMSWEYTYYNENGEPTWSDGPRFDPEDYVWRDYDGGGRKTQEIRWRTQGNTDAEGVEPASGDDLFATTFTQYDPFGNLVRTIDPLGNYSVKKYDSIGQLLREEFYSANGALLATNGFAYNAAGDVTNAFNALGGSTQKSFTSTGKPKFQKNPDGSTSAWLYLADGRLRREYQGNGSYWETSYDDANRKVTKIFYSAAAASLATNSTVLDRRGNVVRTTDAAFNTWTNLFDGLDRIKVSAGPVITTVNWNPGGSPEYTTNNLQQTTTHVFDSSGKTNIVLNGLGEKIVTALDALGRPISAQTYASNTVTPVRVTSTAYTADHHGYTVTDGTGADAISTTTYTDTYGNPVLTIQYPWQGFLQYTWTRYDRAGNRLQSDVFSSDSYYAWTESAWTYDGLNRVKTERVGDGATFTYNRDALGNVTNRLMPGNLQWFANYNAAGQMLKEWTTGTGNAGTRTNTYSYYSPGNVWAGQLQTSTDGRGVTCGYSYDAWLRAATNVFSGSSSEHNLTRVLAFDARGLNTGATEWFGSSSVAPTSTVSRAYNAYNQLQSEAITLGGASFSTASQTWNVAGRRSGLSLNGANYGFGWRADGALAAASSPAGSAGYTWNNAGQLNTRTVGGRTSTCSRDGMGRPWEVDTDILGSYVLIEELGWTSDGLLGAHTVYRSDFTDVREYAYDTYNRRLTNEIVSLSASKRWTNNLVYDGNNDANGGPGVLTRQGSASASAANWNAATDPLARVGTETNNVIRRAADGRVNGPSTVKATLDGVSVGTTILGTNGGQWRASLDLTPGTHQLSVTAYHTSGQFSTNAVSWFTNSAATDRAIDIFDPSGQLTRKVWLSSNGTTNRTQDLFWDAKGRLWKVVERDSGNSGYDWTAVYDAFDRRLQTTTTAVTNGVAATGQAKTIRSYFDPSVEFLEVGLSYDSQTTWKLHGPDLNGAYGGMQGVGGLEAVQTGYSQPVVLISDVRGNVVQQYDTWTRSLTYSGARPTGYGAAPGYEPVALGYGSSFGDAVSWRGKWKDITGYYWLGRRYYGPQSGSWLSYDSVWNVRDPNWFTFCGDDPINYFDPDGRFGKQVANFAYNGGLAGYGLRELGGYLDSCQTDNAAVGAGLGYYGSLVNSLASMSAPSTYVNGLSSYGHNVAGYYNDGGLLPATSYAFTSWNVGSIYSGAANFDLHYDTAGQEVGDWYQRSAVISGGVASTAGIAAGGLGIYNAATASAGAGAAPPVAGPGLVHLTDQAGVTGISQSGNIVGTRGIFAVPEYVAAESTGIKVLRTGLTPARTAEAVPIPQAAQSLFQQPVPIGPYSAWKYAGGVQYAPPGAINTATGAFTPTPSLIGPGTLIYGPDVLFWGGIGSAAGISTYGGGGR